MKTSASFSLSLMSILVCSSQQFDSLTTSQVDSIKNELRTVIRGPSLATAVRLSFHDCVGGCNGCLNVENDDNAGLANIVADLDALYTTNGYDTILSRADFWALTGIYAVDKTIELNNDDCDDDECLVPDSGLVFQWGRQDCDTAPYTDVDVGLPSATGDYIDTTSFFSGEFGFDVNETAALLGAHTLGRAATENSGFNGVWISGESSKFNNEYYKKLVDPDLEWNHRDNTRDTDTSHWQWSVPRDTFMLNVDVCLYKDIIVNEDGKSSCDFTTCADSSTASAVEAFAASNDVWIAEFNKVYTKMLAHGSDALQDLS